MTANNGVMAWKERLIQVLYIMVGLVIAFPILYALMISFMDPAQVLAGGVNLIPKKWTLENPEMQKQKLPELIRSHGPRWR